MGWQMAMQGKRIVFIKYGSLAAGFRKGVCSAGVISISETGAFVLSQVGQVRPQSVSTPYLPESACYCVREEPSKGNIVATEK
jgi:hypothetical protein